MSSVEGEYLYYINYIHPRLYGDITVGDIRDLEWIKNHLANLRLTQEDGSVTTCSNTSPTIINDYRPKSRFSAKLDVKLALGPLVVIAKLNYRHTHTPTLEAKIEAINLMSKWKTLLQTDDLTIVFTRDEVNINMKDLRLYLDTQTLKDVASLFGTNVTDVGVYHIRYTSVVIQPIHILLDVRLHVSRWFSAENIDIYIPKMRFRDVTVFDVVSHVKDYVLRHVLNRFLFKYLAHIKGTPIYVSSLIKDLGCLVNVVDQPTGKILMDVARQVSRDSLNLIIRWLADLSGLLGQDSLTHQPKNLNDGIADAITICSNATSVGEFVKALNRTVIGLRNQLDPKAREDAKRKYGN
jgi:hypothetical protein